MESKEKTSFQIINNHFQNYGSDFAYHTTLSTTANQSKPFYAKISVTRNASGIMILGIKTFQSIMQVFYKNTEFQKHKKLVMKEELLEKQHIAAFTFRQDIFSDSQPPILLVGYKSGIISLVDCMKERLLALYNFDDRSKNAYKSQPVSHIAIVPTAGKDEMLVMFEDSTAMRYKLTTKHQNTFFIEKLKKFEAKTSFNKAFNRFKHKIKTKDNLCYCRYINERKPEFSNFFAYNQENFKNPMAYYKFNHRTIHDMVIKRHSSFVQTLYPDSNDQEVTVLAFTSLDGYLVIFEFEKMIPLLSYKNQFGGINSLTFSENGELIALSGQDDYITVLDLNTLTTLRCQGHKSFVNKAIFQTISMSSGEETTRDRDESGIMDSTRSLHKTPEKVDDSGYIRIIGAGMDANLSFWEFNKNIFGKKKWINIEESQLPIRLELNKMPESKTILPLYMEPVKDAVGWAELCDNMLIQCGYDGVISTYIVRDIIDEETAREHGFTTRREKQDLRPANQEEEPKEEDQRIKSYEEQMRREELRKRLADRQAKIGQQREGEESLDNVNQSATSQEGLNKSSNNWLTPTKYKSEGRENATPKLSYGRLTESPDEN